MSKGLLKAIVLSLLTILFVYVWVNVFMTSKRFEEKLDKMVLGEDYFVEDVIITDKRAESDNDSSHENYFFYYNDGASYEYDKRMQVPGNVYTEYAVGDMISAYTTDHKHFSYVKAGILPKTEYKNNELSKCIGVLLGIAIFALSFWGIWDRKYEKGNNYFGT